MSQGIKSAAVLGTGIMGAPIARHIAAAGIETRVWNRTRERAEALSGDVASVADSPAEAAAGADAVIAMLADAGAVRAVMVEGEGALEAMDADATWIQMSTIGIAATEEMAALAEERGVAFVDAPVVGTRQPAEEGQLTVLASGPEESRERCSPVFEAVGSKVIWLGAAGAGNRMKLVFNNWVLTLTVGLAETFALAEALGIDPDAFLDGIRGGPMGVAYADLKGKMILEREFEPSFPLYLAAKDARLILDAASDLGLDPLLAAATERRLSRAVELGHGQEDMAAAYLAVRG